MTSFTVVTVYKEINKLLQYLDALILHLIIKYETVITILFNSEQKEETIAITITRPLLDI